MSPVGPTSYPLVRRADMLTLGAADYDEVPKTTTAALKLRIRASSTSMLSCDARRWTVHSTEAGYSDMD